MGHDQCRSVSVLYFGLRDAELPAVCIEARHAKAVMTAMHRNKNDRNDARALVHLVRSGWFKAVHVKSRISQELRTLLVAREFLVNKLRDHENEIRGLLRPFGLKVGRVSASGFEARIRELVEGSPRLELCMDALLQGRAAMMTQLAAMHRELLRVTAGDELCRRFMTIPGVGPVTALAFRRPSTIRHASADPAMSAPTSASRPGSSSPARPTVEGGSADLATPLREPRCSPPRT